MPENTNISEMMTCTLSGEPFPVYQDDVSFLEKVSPIFDGKKYQIPLPEICPQERFKQRYAFRNERNVYQAVCAGTGKSIFSMYDPTQHKKVYSNDYFYSDNWSPISYGKTFDFDRDFFSQFDELNSEVPKRARSVIRLENSDYCNNASDLKDCYLVFNSWNSEKVLYSNRMNRSYSCLDCSVCNQCRGSYECVDCINSENLFYSQNCTNCSDSYFLQDCIGCRDCFGSRHLRNAQYVFFGEQLSKEVYQERIRTLNLDTQIDQISRKIQELSGSDFSRAYYSLKAENSIGDYLENCENVWMSYEITDSKNLRYCSELSENAQDCMDVSVFGGNVSNIYYCSVIGHQSEGLLFCFDTWNQVSNALYSGHCQSSSDIFGCIGLHSHESHCILNTSYSKHEYEMLCGKIIDHMRTTGEWGEFFPINSSAFSYNQSSANIWYPLSEDEAKSRGYEWSQEQNVSTSNVETYIPLAISQYTESIVGSEIAKKNISHCLKSTLICQETGKTYRITEQELAFYIDKQIPIPRIEHNVRFKKRFSHRNPRNIELSKCSMCSEELYTSISGRKILCESCYSKEVY